VSFEPYFDAATRHAYTQELSTGSPVKPKDITLWVDVEHAMRILTNYPCAAGKGDCSNAIHGSTDIAEVAYLDVGRWGGGGAWPAHREFGVICGRTALLCSYDQSALAPSTTATWEPVAERDCHPADHQAASGLLNHLSQTKLGAVTVDDAVSLSGRVPAPTLPRNDIVVVLGDLHLPVMTDPSRTYLSPPSPRRRAATGHGNQLSRGGAYRRLCLRLASVESV